MVTGISKIPVTIWVIVLISCYHMGILIDNPHMVTVNSVFESPYGNG